MHFHKHSTDEIGGRGTIQSKSAHRCDVLRIFPPRESFRVAFVPLALHFSINLIRVHVLLAASEKVIKNWTRKNAEWNSFHIANAISVATMVWL